MRMPNRTGAGENAEGEIEFPAFDSAADHALHFGHILRIDGPLNHRDGDLDLEIEAEDAPNLLGPIVFVGPNVPGEAAGFAEALSLRQVAIGSSQVGLAGVSAASASLPSVTSWMVPMKIGRPAICSTT